MSAVQQVYFAKEKYSIYIKGIKPDEDNYTSGTITIYGNPIKLERNERYHIEGDMLYTDNYQIPMPYVINFLAANDCVTEKDGESFLLLKEVKFKLNVINN